MTQSASDRACLPEQNLLAPLRSSSPMAEPQSDRRRYESWVRDYAPALFHYACHLAGRRHLAEDLLQETFTEAWKSLPQQKDAAKARGWLFQILRHRHARYLRDRRRDRTTQALAESSDAHPPDRATPPLQTMAEQDSLQAALDRLSPLLRETFLMVFAQGLTCRETALALGVPIGTVLSRLDSARRKLRESLSETPIATSDQHKDLRAG